jgi:hypothetical protein
LPKGVVASCGTCKTFGYTNYIQNDPIYKNMELWTEGAFYNSTTTEAPKVKLEVYFEALCPGCQEFTTGALKDVLALDDIRQITDFKIVPYVSRSLSLSVLFSLFCSSQLFSGKHQI